MTTFAQESAARTQEVLRAKYEDELSDAKRRADAQNAIVADLEKKIAELGGKSKPAAKPAEAKR